MSACPGLATNKQLKDINLPWVANKIGLGLYKTGLKTLFSVEYEVRCLFEVNSDMKILVIKNILILTNSVQAL